MEIPALHLFTEGAFPEEEGKLKNYSEWCGLGGAGIYSFHQIQVL